MVPFVEEGDFIDEVLSVIAGQDRAEWPDARRERCPMMVDSEDRVIVHVGLGWFKCWLVMEVTHLVLGQVGLHLGVGHMESNDIGNNYSRGRHWGGNLYLSVM